MNIKKMTLPLAALAGAAILLLGLSAGLHGLAEANRASERQQTLELLLPGSTIFTPEAYTGEDESITGVFRAEGGCVVETTVAGYVDDMRLWIGVDDHGSVTGITVRSMAETWGLGRSALTDETFLKQFLRTDGDAAVGENVDALTGATVTSKAIARAVNSAAAFVTGADISSGATVWGG